MKQMSKGETLILNKHRMVMDSFTDYKTQALKYKNIDPKNRAYRKVNGVYQLFKRTK